MHPLSLCYKNTGWACDGTQGSDGCLSKIDGYHQTKGLLGYYCKNCDFDLCEKCMYFYYEEE